MARRIGAEVVRHYKIIEGDLKRPKRAELVGTYRGCWMSFGSSTEGMGTNENVQVTPVGVWIPQNVSVHGADDYFVWERHPDDELEADGDVARWLTRRGQLRACFIPLRKAR